MIKKLAIYLAFSGLERAHYLEALSLQFGKSKALHAAKFLADEKHASDGLRYYVLDTYGVIGDFTVLNSKEVYEFKKQGIIKKALSFKDLIEISSYRTKD